MVATGAARFRSLDILHGMSSVRHVSTKSELLAALGDPGPEPRAIILIGGADQLDASDRRRLERLFGRLVGYLDETRTTVVDGGTDSGVMHLIGRLRTELDATFALVGVLPAGALTRTTRVGAPIKVAPGHSQVLAVPGVHFGEETDWLFAAADHLAGGAAPALLVNGGGLSMHEARLRLDGGHRVVAVAGTGRAADALAADEGLRASGRLRVIEVTADATEIAAALQEDAA